MLGQGNKEWREGKKENRAEKAKWRNKAKEKNEERKKIHGKLLRYTS